MRQAIAGFPNRGVQLQDTVVRPFIRGVSEIKAGTYT
jgi:hypothetical protein